MKYTYLLVNLGSVLVPLIFSFHPALKFYKTWKALVPALFLSTLPFVFWDIYFTREGHWGFNPDYVSGLYVFNLPLEEVLFFICIPYACVFTYHCIDILWKRKQPAVGSRIFWISPVLAFFLLLIGIAFFNQPYTALACISTSLLLLLSHYVLRISWLWRFYPVFLILLLPFLIVNGILTGTGLEAPIVWYHDSAIIGWRILTIPVEDSVYALEMILLNLLLYQFFLKNGKRRRGEEDLNSYFI